MKKKKKKNREGIATGACLRGVGIGGDKNRPEETFGPAKSREKGGSVRLAVQRVGQKKKNNVDIRVGGC